MDNTLTTLVTSAALDPMHLLYNLLHEVMQSAAFLGAFYIVGAALCRLRKSPLRTSWSALYAALLGRALWFIYDAINGQVTDKDIADVAIVATYIFLTQPSWQPAVPVVAQPRVKTK